MRFLVNEFPIIVEMILRRIELADSGCCSIVNLHNPRDVCVCVCIRVDRISIENYNHS